MIRWYDYILAIFAADLMLGMLLWGFNSTSWWEPMVAGLCAGLVWQLWKNDYCAFRLKQEHGK